MNVPDTGAQDMTEIQMKAPFDTEARGFTSLRRPDNLPDEIAHQIRQRILNGSLAHGQRLPTEHELATAFDVSRNVCLLYTSPSPRDQRGSRMPSSA